MEHNILNKAFSLLELLIVIAIIGILVSVGVVSYSTAQKKSRDSRRTSDMKAIQAAFEQYYADNNGNYPPSCASPGVIYLPAGVPSDPKNVIPNVYSLTSCTTSSYCFCADLESGAGNSSNASCGYGAGSFFCVSNLQ